MIVALLVGCTDDFTVDVPEDFPALPVPTDNALTADRVSLGKRLFFDTQLSRTREVSCASCHLPDHAFADPRQFSIGVDGNVGTRNAPALVNLAYNTSFFWDGGAPTLEQQAIAPIINPLEMDMKIGDVVDRLAQDASYVDAFARAYDSPPSPGTLTRALAAFERTLVSGNSRYDRFQRGDRSALSAAEQRGMAIALGERGECFHCHVGFNFTNNSFRNNGLYERYTDIGRARVTELDSDIGKFKVPTLRNVALTAPYMHDGSLPTLEDVVDHYSSGGFVSETVDPAIRPLDLTSDEKHDLVAFLRALTDEPATQPQ
jgi:cytochrome c peroxidase